MEWLDSEFWEIKCTEDKNAFYECFAVVTKKKTLKFVMNMKCNASLTCDGPSPSSICNKCNSNCHVKSSLQWDLFIQDGPCYLFLEISKYLTSNKCAHDTCYNDPQSRELTCPSYDPMPQGSCLYTISNPVATEVAVLVSTLATLLSVNTSKRNGVWNAAIKRVYCQWSVIAQ